MFYDVHCHLELLKDIDNLSLNATKKNILIVYAGVNPKTNRLSLKYSSKYKNIKSCLGIYPDEVLKLGDKEIESELKFIYNNKEKIVGIGEIGLDKTYDRFEDQIKLFEKLVKLAIKLDLPVIVHSRKAEEETIEILEKLGAKKAIMHCFSGGMKLVERIEKNGWMISIPSNVVYSTHFQEVVKKCDLRNLLCETDSPFLSPDKKYPNSPINVLKSYEMISIIKEKKLKDVEKQIMDNFLRIFS